ncbi:MAG TPA: hypothetical protein VJ890_29095 [Vineibacter sp.]|nr:hypothetical protein [Vineibacter sp.]
MAEPPSTATRLLDDTDYPGFADYVTRQGWARGSADAITSEARRLHTTLSAQRHPPGPTPAHLTLMGLVDSGYVDPAVLDAL